MNWGLVLVWLGSASAAPVETNELDALYLGRWGYEVPFALPPAPRGVVPELGLSLDHGQLAGPVGLGWGLRGLHRVERRGPSGAVPAFDGTDEFYVDGQRLYGTEGPGQSGYRLEVDDNRIFHKQEDGGQELWVAQRDGWTWWYGERVTGGSVVGRCATEAVGEMFPCDDHPGVDPSEGPGIAWHLARVEDPAGNVIDYTYTGRAGGADPDDVHVGAVFGHVLDAVAYADGTYTVDLHWEGRPDEEVSYRGGAAWVDALRLSAVEVRAGASSLWTYDLVYLEEDIDGTAFEACPGESAPVLGGIVEASALHRVVRTAPDGLTRQVGCFETEWAPADFAEEATEEDHTAMVAAGSTFVPVVTDWDGDGASAVEGLWYGSSGGLERCDVEVLCDEPSQHLAIEDGYHAELDLDGDGRLDALIFEEDETTRTLTRRFVRGSAVITEIAESGAEDAERVIDPQLVPESTFVDLDGDGLPDLVHPTGWAPNLGRSPWFRDADFVDANAVGLLDWYVDVARDWTTGLVFDEPAVGADGLGLDAYLAVDPTSDDQVITVWRWGDFNQDGLADVGFFVQSADLESDEAFPADQGYSMAWLGDGYGGFFAAPWCDGADVCLNLYLQNGAEPDDQGWLVADLDRDGRSELFAPGLPIEGDRMVLPSWAGDATGWNAARVSLPTGMTAPVDESLCYEDDELRRLSFFIDVDGDGWSDAYQVEYSSGNGARTDRVWTNLGGAPRGRVTRLHGAWGGVTELTYGVALGATGSGDLPVAIDVVASVTDHRGTTELWYDGGTFEGGRFRGFTDVHVSRDDGGSTWLKHAVSPAFAGRQVWRAELRADGTLAFFTYHHFLRGVAEYWLFDDEPPYFNPERRSCRYEVGPGATSGTGAVTQSTDIETLATECTQLGVPTDFAGRAISVVYGWERHPEGSPQLSNLAAVAWVPNGQLNGVFPDDEEAAPEEWDIGDVPALGPAFPVLDHAPPGEVAVPTTPALSGGGGPATTETRVELTLYTWDADQYPSRVWAKRDPTTTADDLLRDFTYGTWDGAAAGKELRTLEVSDLRGGWRQSEYTPSTQFGLPSALVETASNALGPETRTTEYTYDHGLVATIDHPDGAVETFARAPCGEVETWTDGAGRVESRELDAACSEVTREWEGSVVTTERDGFGRPTRRTTTAEVGGAAPPVVEEWVYDDAIADADDRDDYTEPRSGRVWTNGTSTVDDDRVELTWLDPWGRVALEARCGNAGGDGGATDSAVLQAMSCDASREELRVWTGYARDGTPRGASRPYRPGEPSVATRWTFADELGEPIVLLDPAPSATAGTWVRTDRERTPGDRTETDPLGLACTTSWTTTAWWRTCAGVPRGGAEVDAWGQEVWSENGAGEGLVTEFDAFGRPARRQLGVGVATSEGVMTPAWTFDFDSRDRPQRRTDPLGATVTWAYDGASRPLTAHVTPGSLGGPAATVSTWSYDDWAGATGSRRVVHTDHNGFITTSWLDGLDRERQRLDADGALVLTAWDGRGEVVGAVDRNGASTTVERDAVGRVVTRWLDGTWGTQLEYTSAGELSAEVDPEGVTTRYDYAWNGQLAGVYRQSALAAAGEWELASWSYRDDGRPDLAYEAGTEVEYQYDALGRRVAACFGTDCSSWLLYQGWSYDDADRVLSFTEDAAEDLTGPATTRWSYNAAGWRVSEEDAHGAITSWQYDATGRLRKELDRDGLTSQWQYDGWGRVTWEDLPHSAPSTWAYTFGTADGEEHQRTAPDGGVWTTWMDARGRPWRSERPDGTGEARFFDGDRPVGVDHLDAGGAAVAFSATAWDARGRPVWEWGPVPGGFSATAAPGPGEYAFFWQWLDGVPGDGRQDVVRIAPDGEQTRWCVQDGFTTCEEVATPFAGRRTLTEYTLGLVVPRVEGSVLEDGASVPREESFGYDAVGRVSDRLSVVGGSVVSTLFREFDPRGTPGLAERWVDGGTLESRYVTETDGLGRVGVVEAWHGGVALGQVEYTYTAAGRPERAVTDWAGGFVYVRDPSTGLVTEVRPEGGLAPFATIVDRDALGRATKVETGSSGEVTAAWDLSGRIASWSATDGAVWESRSWSYDARGRAEVVSHTDATGTWTESRGYQEPGWLVSETRTDASGAVFDTRSYVYDEGGNRLESWSGGVLEAASVYDGSFLLATNASPAIWTRDAITTDPSGRVVSTAADGRESGLAVPAGPSYRFGRDPWGRPVTTEEGGQVREQVWGNPGGVWPLAGVDETGAATLVVAVEGLLVGVVTDGAFAPAASDPAGNAVFVGTEWLGTPDAWGLDAVEPTTTSFRHVFAGLEVLPGTGGYHLAQHRLYDAGTGRFARMDPLGVAGGPSRFTYAENDPTSRWDPTGLSAADCGSSAQLPHPENLRATMTTESWPQNAYTAESLLAAATGDVDRRRSAVWAFASSRSWSPSRGTEPVGGPSGPEAPGGPVADGWDGQRRWAPWAGALGVDGEEPNELTNIVEDGKRVVRGISPEDAPGACAAAGGCEELLVEAESTDEGRRTLIERLLLAREALGNIVRNLFSGFGGGRGGGDAPEVRPAPAEVGGTCPAPRADRSPGGRPKWDRRRQPTISNAPAPHLADPLLGNLGPAATMANIANATGDVARGEDVYVRLDDERLTALAPLDAALVSVAAMRGGGAPATARGGLPTVRSTLPTRADAVATRSPVASEGAAMAGKRLGHTFTKHGSANTEQLLRQAQGSGQSVGQWLDDAAAERFIADHLGELSQGAKTVDLPAGLGRVVNPDGTFSAATRARLVPSGSGVKTAYPLPE